MSKPKFKATMTIPENGSKLWTDIMQNPANHPVHWSIEREGEYIVAAVAKFSNGVFVVGGVTRGKKSEELNIPSFMVFDKNCNRIGGSPIDANDWEDFGLRKIQFGIDPDDEFGEYLLSIVEAKPSAA
jgi:hypothetical protein